MKYDAINAKIRGMSGKLMKRRDYLALASRGGVSELWEDLKGFSGYDRAIASLSASENGIHRSDLEQHILLALIADFEKIYIFMGDHSQRGYLDAFFLRYEIDLLKQLLCAAFDKRPDFTTAPGAADFLERKLKIDTNKLLRANNATEFIEALEGTQFHAVLSDRFVQDQTTLFEMEMKLDVYYYMRLNQMLKLLDKRNKTIMRGLSGIEIDLRNIQWIYRLRTYYRISPGAIYSYLVPLRYRLSREMVNKMIEAADHEELLAAVNNTPYFERFDDRDGYSIETAVAELLTAAHKRAMIENPNSLATAAAYLFFKETEIRNVISLIECVRYNMKADEALEFLVTGD